MLTKNQYLKVYHLFLHELLLWHLGLHKTFSLGLYMYLVQHFPIEPDAQHVPLVLGLHVHIIATQNLTFVWPLQYYTI
jgi:hypothetical protein